MITNSENTSTVFAPKLILTFLNSWKPNCEQIFRNWIDILRICKNKLRNEVKIPKVIQCMRQIYL